MVLDMKKITALFICLLILVTSILPVYAANSFDQESNFDPILSDVEDDLSKFYFDDRPFSFSDYLPDKSVEDMSLISMYEFGYVPRDSYINGPEVDACEAYYDLIFYVYNPSLLKVVTSSTRNSVQLSLSNGLAYGYCKYELLFLDQSDDGLFLKFCLDSYEFPIPFSDNKFEREHFSSFLDPDYRRYLISGIEIETEEKGVVEYAVAYDYTFTGSCFDGTLRFTNQEFSVLKLDVHSTSYRTETSSKGWGFQNQLDSVYFSIPNSILDYYGKVHAVHFETTKKRVNGITYADALSYFFSFKARNGVSLIDYSSFVDTNSRYGLQDLDWAWYSLRLQNNGILNVTPALGWNARAAKNINYIFWMEFWDYADSIPGEKILEYLRKYDLVDKTKWIDELPLDEQPFVSPVKTEYVNAWISVDDSFNLLSYNTNHSLLDKLLDYGLYIGSFGDDSSFFIDAIVPVSLADLSSSDGSYNEIVADNLFIDVHDVDELRDYVESNPDSTTYLFRFSQQDYYAEDVFIYDYDDPSYIGVKPGSAAGVHYGWEDVTKDGYYWEQTAYLDFDIIEIEFYKQGTGYTTFPVVSSPIDILGDATAPYVPPVGFLGMDLGFLDFGSGSGSESVGTFLGIFFIILLIIIVVWLIIWFRNRKKRRRRSGTTIQIFTGDDYNRRRRRRK